MAANGGFPDFNLCRIFKKCKGLKIFTVEFKDGLMVTPPVSYVGKFKNKPRALQHNHKRHKHLDVPVSFADMYNFFWNNRH